MFDCSCISCDVSHGTSFIIQKFTSDSTSCSFVGIGFRERNLVKQVSGKKVQIRKGFAQINPTISHIPYIRILWSILIIRRITSCLCPQVLQYVFASTKKIPLPQKNAVKYAVISLWSHTEIRIDRSRVAWIIWFLRYIQTSTVT